MRVPNNYDITAVRNPTNKEIEQISKYVCIYFSKRARFALPFAVILAVIGLISASSIISGISTTSVLTAVIGLCCVAVSAKMISDKKHFTAVTKTFASGNFLVIDGRVTKIESNPDMAGCANVRFASHNGTESKNWYRVRKEHLAVGIPLIVTVYYDSRQKPFEFAFTEYMLTEEGLSLLS